VQAQCQMLFVWRCACGPPLSLPIEFAAISYFTVSRSKKRRLRSPRIDDLLKSHTLLSPGLGCAKFRSTKLRKARDLPSHRFAHASIRTLVSHCGLGARWGPSTGLLSQCRFQVSLPGHGTQSPGLGGNWDAPTLSSVLWLVSAHSLSSRLGSQFICLGQ